jgi:N utilization substance protein A
VQAVVAELGGEKIDIIPWSDDPAQLVANALSPAQVVGVRIDEEARIANVTVPERMLSLAIGREGQNARLAAKMTGWRIDIRSDLAPPAEAPVPKVAAPIVEAPPEPLVEEPVAAVPVAVEMPATKRKRAAVAVPVAVEAAPAKPKRASRARKVAVSGEVAP